jgi:hypothetical protein
MNSSSRNAISVLALSVWALACAPETGSEAEPKEGAGIAVERSKELTGEFVSDPREYLRVHNLASSPQAEGWPDAIQTLAFEGGAFTLEHLAGVDKSLLSESQHPLLDAAVERIAARLHKSDAGFGPGFVVQALERAALADLMCDSLEGVLLVWTLNSIESHLQNPVVLAEVERLAAGYTPTVEVETLFSSMDERVPKYARQLLESVSGSAESQ